MTLYAKFVEPEAGYNSDIENAKHLIKDALYPVAAVTMGQSSTTITLQGKSGYYNSVHFKFFKRNIQNEFTEHDIYRDPVYNPYIKNHHIFW